MASVRGQKADDIGEMLDDVLNLGILTDPLPAPDAAFDAVATAASSLSSSSSPAAPTANAARALSAVAAAASSASS